MNFPPTALQRAKAVDLVIFDVDGVLTDGRLYYTDGGEELKAFQVQDGYAIKLLRSQGIKVAIVTGRHSPIVTRRAGELGIEHVYQGMEDKAAVLTQLAARTDVKPDRMAHVGDDLPDIALFECVGMAVSVPNGHPATRAAAHYVTSVAGGAGVAREVCQLILTAKGLWPYR